MTEPERKLNPKIEQREDGLFYSKATGRRVPVDIAYEKTPEEKAAWKKKMNDARTAKREERIANGEDPNQGRKKPTKADARAQALEDLKPTAIKVMEEILRDRHGVRCPECDHVIEKLKAPLAQVIATAVKVIEYADGKPVQKIEQDLIQRIEFVLGDYEPRQVEAAPPLALLTPPAESG